MIGLSPLPRASSRHPLAWIGTVWLVACSVAATPLSAQIVTGRLIDDATGEGVSGAELVLIGQDRRTVARAVSGDDGAFLLRPEQHGWYRLGARRLGYATTTSAPLDLVEADSLDVELRIAVEAIPIAPLTVVGRQRRPDPRDPRLERWDYYERKEFYGEKSGFGHFLEGEDLRPTAFRITDLIRDVPGIHVRPSGRRGYTVTGRLGRGCLFFLNGMPAGDVSDVSASSIVAVEVYPGTVVPQYYVRRLGRPYCVVAAWTGFRP